MNVLCFSRIFLLDFHVKLNIHKTRSVHCLVDVLLISLRNGIRILTAALGHQTSRLDLCGDRCASETVVAMELSQERDASAIGNLFQQIINDMKVNANLLYHMFIHSI